MPKFVHDCEVCKYIGEVEGHDLYTCVTSIVLRFGDDGPEYNSIPEAMLDDVAKNSPMWATARDAIINHTLVEFGLKGE